MSNIAIIGSGSWGVALGMHLASIGNNVKIWSFEKEEADLINNEKKCKFLPKITIPDKIVCSLDYKDVIDGADIILHVTPSKFTRNIVRDYKQYVDVNKQPIIVCSKGLELSTLKILTDVVKEEIPNARVGALSGPSHAEEVSVGIPTVLVSASEDEYVRNYVQDLFMNENMRVYTSDDVIGVEYGSALKNIIAFCAGAAISLGCGDNTYAALLTRGLAEIARLGEKVGAKRETFYGLTGLGDLIVTCGSEHSRNRKAGKLVGQGLSLDEVKKEVGMVIESIDNIEAAHKLKDVYDVEMPIVDEVYNVLYNNENPKDAIQKLMLRDKKPEM
ncbi:MAG: NAD(P)-dependent glycerol-3-phosphate dehydrogenase [Clostridia bacterium]|nr:NAD(P)-dependent glycerol-3-phosphate dehydrogenase [Clostridia bacterium]